MAYVKAEAIEQARRIDLLTYLSHYEPGNLVHISGNNYCTKWLQEFHNPCGGIVSTIAEFNLQ